MHSEGDDEITKKMPQLNLRYA